MTRPHKPTDLRKVDSASSEASSRFPWRSFDVLAVRKEGLLLVSQYPASNPGVYYSCEAKLLADSISNEDLGSAVFKSFEKMWKVNSRSAAAAHAKVRRNPAVRAQIDKPGWPAVWITFNGAYDPDVLRLHALTRSPGDVDVVRNVPVSCDAAALGAAIRKILKMVGVTFEKIARTETPPLDRMFSSGGYRGLVISSPKKQSSIHAAHQELKAAKLIDWSEKVRELGEPRPCAARVKDSACHDLETLIDKLRDISKRQKVDLTVALATRSTDLLAIAHLRSGVVKRLLVYGFPEQHSWSRVAGRVQSWESAVLEGSVRSPRSAVVVTNAMECAEAALRAAYQ